MKTYGLVERVATPTAPQNAQQMEYVTCKDLGDLAARVAVLEKEDVNNV